MKSLGRLSLLASEAKDRETESLLYDIYMLVREMIAEEVPKVIQQYKDEIEINVNTYINGKHADLTGLEQDIRKIIDTEINKIK